MSTKQTSDQHEQTNRRTMLAALGAALGALAVAGCDEEPEKISSDDPVQKSVGTLLAAGTSIVWVDSIAGSGTNLQGSTGTSLGNIVVVGGYLVPGDGGGGAFYWDASAVDSQDLGTIFGTGTGRWKRLYSGPVNVRWFGATGDGTTDDRSAIQAALANVTSSKGSIHFPSGTYVCCGEIDVSSTSGVFFIGDTSITPSGSGGTTIHFTHADLDSTHKANGFKCAGANGLTFKSLNIDADNASFTGTLLNFASGESSPGFGHAIDNCVLTAPNGTLIDTQNTLNCTVDRTVYGPCHTAVQGPTSFANFANAWTFTNCSNQFHNVTTDV